MYPSPTALSYPHIALDWFGSPYYSHDLRSLPPIYDFYTVRFLLSIYAVVSWEDVWSLINIYLACCILGVSELLHQCLTSLFWSSDEGCVFTVAGAGAQRPSEPVSIRSTLLFCCEELGVGVYTASGCMHFQFIPNRRPRLTVGEFSLGSSSLRRENLRSERSEDTSNK